MEEQKSLIPGTVLMMDCGLAHFGAASEEEAYKVVGEVMERHGGTCVGREGNYLIYNFSGTLRLRYVSVLVDAAEEGYTASFREGNAPTDLMHYGLLVLTLVVMGLLAWLIRSWWSLLPCVAVIALYLWVAYSPERAFVKRVGKIREELGR